MKFFVAAMMAFGISSAAAQSAPPYAGAWAVEGACRDANDDLKVTFSAKLLEYYAGACRVVSSRRLSKSGNAAHRLKLTCEGEGSAKTKSEVILVVLEKTEPRPELLLHIDAATWDTVTYQRCGQ